MPEALMFHLMCYLLFSLVIPSECPDNRDLPVLNEKGDQFYCAFSWNGHGDIELMKACDGNRSTWMDGQDYSVTGEDYNADLDTEMLPVGSIMVKAGCTLYGYEVCLRIFSPSYQGHKFL